MSTNNFFFFKYQENKNCMSIPNVVREMLIDILVRFYIYKYYIVEIMGDFTCLYPIVFEITY